MMYHAWIRPGKKHKRVRVILMMESAVQNPALTQTNERRLDQHRSFNHQGRDIECGSHLPAMGGKKMASIAKKKSELHMAYGCSLDSDSKCELYLVD